MPKDIRLEGLEDEVLHRYPAPVGLLTILELLSEVLLERGREVNAVVIIQVPLHLTLEREVLRLLEGWLDIVGEGAEGRRVGAPIFEALDELIEVGDLAGVVDTAPLVVEAGVDGRCHA